ncbi:hypothetical protein N7456_005326 [Penicillium angulare]|uniref:Queuine tRNA-ribosyltransferase accessory subunit 2 n=1 Tax=Penicillium angulare TaxID=116970 RepID=A0A9W9FYA9_9EURO|nr:hypothetical protein N7456_005326 [Penicillium angulare]
MNPESSQAPEMTFSVLGSAAPVLAPRVGKLAIPGRKAISTPHYLPVTSRGVVPHISNDNVRNETSINSFYVGLEDFIEKSHKSPVYRIPAEENESRLRKFMCAPADIPLIMSPRRFPPIPCPPVNTETSIAISTCDGFRQLSADHYLDAIHKLTPDIIVGLADMVLGRQPGNKRRGKMVDRTHAYTRDALERLYGAAVAEDKKCKAAYFAPILPLDNTQQSLYLDDLETEFRDHLSGLALYESASLSFIPESLGALPRLLIDDPSGPHDVLREVSLGADLMTLPFIGNSSDAGIAFDFTFPAPPQEEGEPPLALGMDMWEAQYARDVSALREGCECYACRKHHRAYLNHLLNAKEMTAWALLQMHNFHVMDRFFQGVQASIQAGTFERDVDAFNRVYALTLPERTGPGPRLRGYQLPAAGPNEPRRTTRVYGRLEDALQKFQDSQSSIATPDTDAEGLEKHGFAEKI